MWSNGEAAAAAMKKAMWIYPMVSGFNPSERWGHSACYSSGHLYVFGGCCGGLHFSDILVLDLESMTWRTLATTGQSPGPRDSHTAVLVNETMIVFGGTNGSTKVNDLHILNLRTKEWSKPDTLGVPPPPRESHTATLVGTDRIVVFGGSGEGEGNYLNDLHVLDIRSMRWTSPEVNGEAPVPRDSHSTVAVGNKLLVYGGDCGDRYYGDIDVLDMDTMTWSKLDVQWFLPGVRAGHGTVTIGTKVYVIGGVGDKRYYSDVWVLDLEASSWSRVDIRGQPPQGRFSHTAVVVHNDIFIYGGCGEDERPLNELLLLQLGEENPNVHRNIPGVKVFGKHWNQVTAVEQKLTNEARRNGFVPSDSLHLKRRRSASSNLWEVESEQEEHSLSLSQNSSPSQSDQDQSRVAESTKLSQGLNLPSRARTNEPPNNWKEFRNFVRRKPEPQQVVHVPHQHETTGPVHNLIGADVRGKVDGAFDSGYLVTATVNGRIFRGVLFAPAPISLSRGAVLPQNPNPPQSQISHPSPNPTHIGSRRRSVEPTPSAGNWTRPFRAATSGPRNEVNLRSDLQGVVLTLGGPGTSHG